MKLQAATNKVAFAKVGIYGAAASGKTFTAAKIAIGMHQHFGLEKPVAMFDTEPAASFIIPLFEEAGVPFLVYDESRALADLMEFLDAAEKEASVAIVDSITHVWKELQVAYLAKTNEKLRKQRRREIFSLEFHHWGPIKASWGKFTDRFLSSRMHMIVCGRAGTSYEYRENAESGKLELITTGTKMATEKELAYEPSLLIEMVRKQIENELINVAVVEKDRANKVNGNRFEFPTFESFLPHFEALNIGGEHFGSMDQKSSSELFEGKTDGDGFAAEKRQREIWAEEIKGLFVHYKLSGQSADAKEKRLSMLMEVFGTRSWPRIESLHSTKLREGFNNLEAMLEGRPAPKDEPDESEIPF